MWREDAVEAGQLRVRRGHEGGEPGDEIFRLEDDVRGAIAIGRLQGVANVACTELGVADVTAETVGQPALLLLEGYVWDIAEGPALMHEAIRIAREAGARVALSLSDASCVERHRAEFLEAVAGGIDIVFADEDEIIALLDTGSFDEVLPLLPQFDALFVMTRSAKGSVIARGEERLLQPAIPVPKVVDTTGAGDAYTAAFLYGLATDRSLRDCARLGTWCATGVIQRTGARIEHGALDGFDQARW